jgi:hypothetical protein
VGTGVVGTIGTVGVLVGTGDIIGGSVGAGLVVGGGTTYLHCA